MWAATTKYSTLLKNKNITINLILEFIIIVLPCILSCTLLSNHAFLLNLFLASISIGLLYIFPSPPSDSSSADIKKKKRRKWDKDSDDDENLEELLVKEKLDKEVDERENYSPSNSGLLQKPFLSAYRSGMIILTCISILAVDFPAFPRRFAKVENFGTSLVKFGS